MKLQIRKGAKVKVITGSDKGKTGTVLVVDRQNMRVKVEGVRVQSRHKAEDGIKKLEGFIDYSNVALIEAAPTGKKKTSKKTAKSKSAE